MRTSLLTFTVAGLLAGASAQATIVDLTAAGNNGTAAAAFFQQVPDQTTGTGVIEPFLRVQGNDAEEGFNTSLPDVFAETKTGLWTHDILISAIPVVVNPAGAAPGSYWQILLDINQNKGGDGEFITLNKLQVFLANGALSSADQYSDLTGGATKVWDLDKTGGNPAGADLDSQVELNFLLNPGSGAGDMFAYIPVSSTVGFTHFYLYTQFGDPNHQSNDGFEEWAVVGQGTPTVPDGGATLMLLGAGLAALGAGRRFLKF